MKIQKPPAWFIPTLSAILSILGIIVSVFLSSVVAENKAAQERKRTYAREKTQVRLSVRADPFPPGFLNEDFLYGQPARPAVPTRDDPYYQKYDLVDTVYRLCALFGWMEFYRRDPSFLNGPTKEKTAIEQHFRGIRKAFGDEFSDEKRKAGVNWIDGFILEDDQRAIGETMLETDKESRGSIMGYGAFCGRLFRIPKREDPIGNYESSQNYWVWNATRFIVELGRKETTADFRRERIKKVIAELDELSRVLDTESH